MKKDADKIHVISPEWKEFMLFGIILIFIGAICVYLGPYSDRPGTLNPLTLCFICILAIVLEWKGLDLLQDYIEVIYCSIFRRRIRWSDIERIELKKKPERTYIYIELSGCPPYPKGKLSDRKFTIYAFRHPIKLIYIKLNFDKEEEQNKIIESFHPIERL